MQVTHESRSAIARSHLFLRLAVECPADKRIEFEAFLEAAIIFARAALHRFKADNSNHPQWKYWWASLRGNPSFEFFRTERDWLLKEASPKIGQRAFAKSVGSSSTGYVPSKAGEFYFFESPDVPATDTVARHLQEVNQVLECAKATFV